MSQNLMDKVIRSPGTRAEEEYSTRTKRIANAIIKNTGRVTHGKLRNYVKMDPEIFEKTIGKMMQSGEIAMDAATRAGTVYYTLSQTQWKS